MADEIVDTPADRLVRMACLTYADDSPENVARARELLIDLPESASDSIAAAVVCAEAAVVLELLGRDNGAATRAAPPLGWPPLMYLAYSRLESPEQHVLDIAASLIAAGADPNDGRFVAGPDTIPFTVLTGVLGGGELDQPAHPHANALARVLLEHGAEPNDAQALYNLQFADDDQLLELLFDHGLGRGDGGPWRRSRPDLVASPRTLLRRLLWWAVVHGQRGRVALLAEHGVDVTAPMRSRTPIEITLTSGHHDVAELLRELGASEPELSREDAFVAAALVANRAAIAQTPDDVVSAARSARPELIVWAAALGRPHAVELLLELGWDVDALGRGDVPSAQPWQTALHTAVEHDDPTTVRLLLARGADISVRDARFDGTARDWAEHLGHDDLIGLLRG